MKKKKKHNIIIVGIALVIVGSIIGYNYYIDQIKQKGLIFGNELEQIQDDVKKLQNNFYSKITQWEEGDITKEELLIELESHVEDFKEIMSRYDKLDPPEPYTSSVELFKLSSQTQLESDIQYIQWLKTGEEAYKTRSDLQLKESFDYEMAALSEFNAAKAGLKP
ncbi:MAG: hypothetical protein GWN01_17905 [Nitrosopumilaceae archaeon]|nr:hypothetical protein [Nitrosopumilaceae archaeon]NIU02695.1 hypothetical protein [Nitrosopumilaceae archaeon]NIU86537.1 hypothetical protein [Nitrosopumilaceae archaeon]NIX63296.1 hypothetical protein [Nitrosopumilaceae archaeon]